MAFPLKAKVDRNFTSLWFSSFLHFATLGMIMPLQSLYLKYRGLSLLEIGFISSFTSLSMMFFPIFMGRLSDLWGRKKTLILSEFSTAILLPIYSLSNKLILFLPLGFLANGFMWSYTSVSSTLIVDMSKVGRVGRSLGFYRISGSLGYIPGTLASGFIIEQYGYEWAYGLAAILACSSALLVLQVVEVKGEKVARTNPLLGLRNRNIVIFFLAFVFSSFCSSASYTFLPLYMDKELSIPKSIIPLAFSIPPFAEIPTMILLGRLSDRIDRRKVIVIALSSYPLRYAVTYLANDFNLIAVAQLIQGFSFAGTEITAVPYLTSLVPSSERGLIIGAYHMTSSISSFIGGNVMGFTVQNLGYRSMYLLATSITTAAIFFFLALQLNRRSLTQKKG